MAKKDRSRMVSGDSYSAILEEYNRRQGYLDNAPWDKPAGISQAFKRAKDRDSLPKVKPQKKY